MLVEWRPEAQESLFEILSYIADKNLYASLQLADEIEHATSCLPEHPYLYRRGRVAGTREIVVHPNYLIVYRVSLETIQILSVLHTRQEYP
ncbi:type II toxin-antitoxin system RelE/ParE family toxin [Undibacterium sp. Ji83W]|uniref:type II toxin-antitoxin system RelE/ParE family toxin n=1 Tax=Undibacterium sp. Ji83W TaxID=3413043 RepID=UPI003BF32793